MRIRGGAMFFFCMTTPSLSINSYIIGDLAAKKCAVIDPTRHVIPLVMQAQNHEMEITDILETHVHADFVSGAKELKHQLNEKPRIHCSAMGGEAWTARYADILVQKGAKIQLGAIRLEAVPTPGHTKEHVAWACFDEKRSYDTPFFLFTGDSLFVGSVGRPDLLGNSEMKVLAPALYHTLFEELLALPDFVSIFPSHGEGSLCGKSLQSAPSSTIGYERRFNSYLKKRPMEAWIENLQIGLPTAPPYFKRLKKLNLLGPPLLNTLTVHHTNSLPIGSDFFILDVRHQEQFAFRHLEGALNIPYSTHFTKWAGWFLPADRPIVLVVDNPHFSCDVIAQLRLIGYDQEIFVLSLEEALADSKCLEGAFPMKEVEDLAAERELGANSSLLDVRSQEEWNSGHIAGALHMELEQLESNIEQLPKDREIVVVCRSGQRASTAASILLKHHFTSVANLRGGMRAWAAASLPVECA